MLVAVGGVVGAVAVAMAGAAGVVAVIAVVLRALVVVVGVGAVVGAVSMAVTSASGASLAVALVFAVSVVDWVVRWQRVRVLVNTDDTATFRSSTARSTRRVKLIEDDRAADNGVVAGEVEKKVVGRCGGDSASSTGRNGTVR